MDHPRRTDPEKLTGTPSPIREIPEPCATTDPARGAVAACIVDIVGAVVLVLLGFRFRFSRHATPAASILVSGVDAVTWPIGTRSSVRWGRASPDSHKACPTVCPFRLVGDPWVTGQRRLTARLFGAGLPTSDRRDIDQASGCRSGPRLRVSGRTGISYRPRIFRNREGILGLGLPVDLGGRGAMSGGQSGTGPLSGQCKSLGATRWGDRWQDSRRGARP